MITKQQQKILDGIGRRMPSWMTRQATKDVRDYEYIEKLKHAQKKLGSSGNSLTLKQREVARGTLNHAIESEMKKKEEVDHTQEVEIERYWQNRIRAEILTGRLEPAQGDNPMKKHGNQTTRKAFASQAH